MQLQELKRIFNEKQERLKEIDLLVSEADAYIKKIFNLLSEFSEQAASNAIYKQPYYGRRTEISSAYSRAKKNVHQILGSYRKNYIFIANDFIDNDLTWSIADDSLNIIYKYEHRSSGPDDYYDGYEDGMITIHLDSLNENTIEQIEAERDNLKNVVAKILKEEKVKENKNSLIAKKKQFAKLKKELKALGEDI